WDVQRSQQCDGEMREVAADSNALLKSPHCCPDGTGLRVVEPQVVMHIVHHSFDARVTRLVSAEGTPREAAEKIGFAITATEQELQSVWRQLSDGMLGGRRVLDIPCALVADYAFR